MIGRIQKQVYQGKMTTLKILRLWILLAPWFFPFLPAKSTTVEAAHVVASTWSSNATGSRCIPRERDALLAFMARFTDPHNYLSSWQGEDCCQWKGVICSNRTGHVVELALHNLHYVNSSIRVGEGQMNSSLLVLRHLRSLDLRDNNFHGTPIPEFIGNLKNLRYLYLSNSKFSGHVPPPLGNLSRLIYLELNSSYRDLNTMYSTNLAWLSRLTQLQYLDMSFMNLSAAFHWAHVVNKLSSLVTLNLNSCGLRNVIQSPEHFNLTSLEYLDLSSNDFFSTSVAAYNLFWDLPSLLHLDMQNCNLQGSIPEKVGNLTSIKILDLTENNLTGTIPRTFRSLHNLEELSLHRNNISGPVSVLLKRLSGNSLSMLWLQSNHLTGRLPDQLGHLSNLTTLNLAVNKISGKLPLGIGALTKLSKLSLFWNNIDGIVTETHFGALTNLKRLALFNNPLVIMFHHSWVPPFKLVIAELGSCKLGPKFPGWLRSQDSIGILEISNTSIVGPIPEWFWITFSRAHVLVLSQNRISGMLSPTRFRKMSAGIMDFSDNLLVGSMPQPPRELEILDLSKNNLSGSLPSELGAPWLTTIALFKNSISGRIPSYLCHLEKLEFLKLSENKLHGPFPNCEGQEKAASSHRNNNISNIRVLNLNNNNLSGEFPTIIRKCQKLILLDLSYNRFFGMLPSWIGDKLPSLVFLSLRSNLFYGHIPAQLDKMKRLKFLDMACNNLSGSVPQSLADLIAMVVAPEYGDIFPGGYFEHIGETTYLRGDSSMVIVKGQQLELGYEIRFMVNFDLSCNILTGPIPEEIGKLVALKNLNLSWNHLNGTIPDSIGGLYSLESLDLSYNEFSGEIPGDLSNLLSLSHLNLSYNNLIGRIPSGNQLQTLIDPTSIYIGNPGLCGPPLPKNCSEIGLIPATPEGHDDRDYEIFIFLAIGSGYMMGLWIMLLLFLFNRNWRIVLFLFSDRLYDWVYVQVTLRLAFLTREMDSWRVKAAGGSSLHISH